MIKVQSYVDKFGDEKKGTLVTRDDLDNMPKSEVVHDDTLSGTGAANSPLGVVKSDADKLVEKYMRDGEDGIDSADAWKSVVLEGINAEETNSMWIGLHGGTVITKDMLIKAFTEDYTAVFTGDQLRFQQGDESIADKVNDIFDLKHTNPVEAQNILKPLIGTGAPVSTFKLYTVQEVDAKLAALSFTHFAGPYDDAADLPAQGADNTLYLVGTATPYHMYAWISGAYIRVGSTDIDLSGYYTKADVDAKVAAVNAAIADANDAVTAVREAEEDLQLTVYNLAADTYDKAETDGKLTDLKDAIDTNFLPMLSDLDLKIHTMVGIEETRAKGKEAALQAAIEYLDDCSWVDLA